MLGELRGLIGTAAESFAPFRSGRSGARDISGRGNTRAEISHVPGSVSRRLKPASDRRVKIGQFGKGRVRPKGLLVSGVSPCVFSRSNRHRRRREQNLKLRQPTVASDFPRLGTISIESDSDDADEPQDGQSPRRRLGNNNDLDVVKHKALARRVVLGFDEPARRLSVFRSTASHPKESPEGFVPLTEAKHGIPARQSGRNRPITPAAEMRETTETLGGLAIRSGAAGPAADVARDETETISERYAGSQTVASSGVCTKKAQAADLGLFR
jgi:hypothetical protein